MSEVGASRIRHRCGSVGTARRIVDHAKGYLGVPLWEVEPVPGERASRLQHRAWAGPTRDGGAERWHRVQQAAE
eukprot:CAMPEP_0182598714 /NCGR_PEP_ID=MMETSP1324-20130603/88840_1 /TAXON_ID=236786 /ORGANISM="Florenciella sp., Strain RCC1587" /LENGTH=73 /DNA_ID=CAMNT_0024816567 /DNA_START=302 /DNA_END=523 /DNA_ORIENTATION=+